MSGDTNGAGLDYLLQQDGTLTYMVSGSLIDDSDSKALELTCVIATFEERDGRRWSCRKH